MRLFEGIMNDKVEKYNIPYRVIRSSRRTVSLQIVPGGEVLVPMGISGDLWKANPAGLKSIWKNRLRRRGFLPFRTGSCRRLPGRRGKQYRNGSPILLRWWA